VYEVLKKQPAMNVTVGAARVSAQNFRKADPSFKIDFQLLKTPSSF